MYEARGGSDAAQNTDRRIRVLLADDSAIVRRGIRQLLSTQSEIEIVGESVNFAQTVQMARALSPQVLVLDLHLPDDDNMTVQEIESLLDRGLQVLAISVWNPQESAELAEGLGAAAFLDKANLADTLIPTVMQLGRKRIIAESGDLDHEKEV
jgi:DNA-binding NarL/FixJ family response regulator